tara:strand:+ start:1346 stop:2323 length:978 start_codon:yes stop_codon:yes gene_type:complete
MRKVLLATTALVAMGGVSAASADVTITGAFSLEYNSWSDNTASTSTNDSSVVDTSSMFINFAETLDNGMAIAGKTGQDGTSSGAMDYIGGQVSGDFGTIGFGAFEKGDGFATATDVTADEAHSISLTDTTAYDGANDIVMPGDEQLPASSVSYLSPAMSGFQFSVGMGDTGAYSDTTSLGAQYVMAVAGGSMTLKYAQSDTGSTTSSATDDVEATSLGLVIASGAATLTLAQNTVGMGTSTTDYTANSAGVTYKVSDTLTVQAYTGSTEDDKDTTYEINDTGMGFTYTIAPGLTASLTHNNWDRKATSETDESGDNTAFAIDLSF